MADPAILLGNNLATLVAAHALARAGQAVTVLHEGRPLGGHFAGMTLDGHDFDLGMVFLERPGHAAPSRDLATYSAARRNDCARFSDVVAGLIGGFTETVRVPTPQVLLDGRRHPDYLIANRLDAFAGCTLPAPLAAAEAGRGHELHAAHKLAAGAFDSVSYAEAGAHNHGSALHAHFFGRFGRKLTDLDGEALLARYHRAAWLPLYYPETLVDAIACRPTGLAEYAFWLPQAGWTGAWVRALQQALAALPAVQLRPEPVAGLSRSAGGFQVQLASGEQLDTPQLFLGVANERAHALLGLPAPAPQAAASIQLQFCLASEEAIHEASPCVMVADDTLQSYRITDLDASSGRSVPLHRVVIEAHADRLQRHATQCAQPAEAVLASEACQLLGMADPGGLRVLKTLVARNAVALPTLSGQATAQADLAALHGAAAGIALSGTLLATGSASMNDQIVQGLQQAQEWS